FDMMQRNAGGIAEHLQSPDLVHDIGPDLVGRYHDVSTAEPDKIVEPRVRADRDAQFGEGGDGAFHHARIPAMEAAGDIRARDEWKQAGIGADGPRAEALADITVEIHGCVRQSGLRSGHLRSQCTYTRSGCPEDIPACGTSMQW